MREKHELEKGIICEKCLGIFSKQQGYTRIKFEKPVVEDTTGIAKVVSRMNLCDSCYEEFKTLIETFTGKKFIETNIPNLNKEQLKKLKEEINNKNNERSKTLIKK